MSGAHQIDKILKKIHNGRPVIDRSFICLTLALICFLSEVGLIFTPMTLRYFQLHLTLSALVLFVLFIGVKRDWDVRFFIILATLFIPLGAIGAGTAFISLLLYHVYVRTKSSLRDLLVALYPEEEYDPVKVLYERINTGLEGLNPKARSVPFQDVMAFGTTEQKRGTVEKILRYYRPEFSRALKLGTRDEKNAIRVISATAITRLDAQYMRKFYELKEEVKKEPHNVEILLEYAKHAEECAMSGVLDADRADKMLKRAIRIYEEYCDRCPGDFDAILALSRLCYAEGDYQKASEWIRLVFRSAEKVPPEVLYWMLATTFSVGKYSVIRSMCKRIAKDPETEYAEAYKVKEYVELWGHSQLEEKIDGKV